MPLRFHWKLFLVVAFAITAIFGIYLSTRQKPGNNSYVPGPSALSQKAQEVVVETQLNCAGSDCNEVKTRTQDDDYAAYFVQAKEKINPFYHSFLRDGRTICKGGPNPDLIILVPTTPAQYREREAIRSSWGSVAKNKQWPFKKISKRIKLVFLIGIKHNKTIDARTEKENRVYKDIIQGDFLDIYNNLPIKILMGLRWVSLYCNEVKFILKADSDMFVHIPLLLESLEEYGKDIHRNGAIFGNINEDAKVRRDGRWAVSKEVYPFPHFPPYAYGNTYVISGNIASRLFSASEYMAYVPVEDAFITGILAKTIEAEHFNVPGFAYWLEHKPSYCDFVKDRKISATKVGVQYMLYIWSKLHSKDNLC